MQHLTRIRTVDARAAVESLFHHLQEQPPLTLLKYTFVGLLGYTAAYIVVYIPLRFLYRITLDPLAGVPGPKSQLISDFGLRFYWNRGAPRGTFQFRAREWHEQYGPIVRTAPNAVHVKDIESYTQVFKVGTKFPKSPIFYNHPATRDSVLDISDFHKAHLRRSALQPYFSKQAVRKLEGLIHEKVGRLLDRLDEAAGRSINLSRAFRCLACDIITSYSYEQCFDALEDPEFAPGWLLAFESLVSKTDMQLIFPALFEAIGWVLERFLTRDAIRRYAPEMSLALEFADICGAAVLKQKQRWDAGERDFTTIFEQLFQDDPKKGRKAATDRELAAEALLTVSAGMDTTGHTLELGMFHLVKNPDIQARLLDELKTVMPGPTSPVTEEALDHLPFLQGVVKESLRFGHGIPGPLPRDAPATGATLAGYYIPAGTHVLNSHYIYHTDPTVFPDPFKFDPARWLVPDTREMERYFMPFSRGARVCIGLNLAWAELTITLARLVRRFEISFADGFRDEDMEWIALFIPITKGMLKITAKERDE